MPAPTQTDILKDLAPEFGAESNTRLTTILSLAALSVNTNIWGAKADMGTALLAAHILTIAKRKGNQGVAEEAVGELSRKYNSPSSDEILMQTSYGTEHLRLRRSLIITPILV